MIVHRYHVIPYGDIDGSNRRFRVPTSYIPGSMRVMLNGLNLPVTEITEFPDEGLFDLKDAPLVGDVVWCHYDIEV